VFLIPKLQYYKPEIITFHICAWYYVDVNVPDRRSRIIPEVVLVRRWGSGNLEGGGVWVKGGAREVSLQATWDRGGRFLSQLGGFQVSRRGYKGEKRGTGKGRKSKGNAPCIVVHCNLCPCMYRMSEMLEWRQLCIYIIIIIGMNVVDNLNFV
jgi:hypothetical protein